MDPNATTPEALNQETQAVQQLLADLCCSLLYPGPVCHGEPHGVVIGCASISSGQIERVDPWSGRRWVMHYPLWSYWGAQFGLVPPDVLASRLFSFICCVAGLKPPSFVSLRPEPTGTASAIAVGAGQIVVNPAPPPAGTPTETVSLPVFAARVLSALAREPAPRGTPVIDVALTGNSGIHLLVPDTAAAPAAVRAAPATAATDLMRTALVAPEVRAAVPPLLRGFAVALGARLIDALPLATLSPPAAVLGPMMVSGVTSVGALLARTPEALYQTVLGKTEAAELSNLLTSAEAKPAEIAGAVAVALKAAASRHALISTDDLALTDAQAALVESLTASLHLPSDVVATALSAALA